MIYKNRNALITGASKGIGKAIAYSLAQKGCNLVLIARDDKELEVIKKDITLQCQVNVSIFKADLSKHNEVIDVIRKVQETKITIDILINNAGFGTHGEFATTQLERISQQIDLNVHALTVFTHTFMQGMLRRNEGLIVNVSSLGGFQADPYMAVYGATKAYVLSFSTALWQECSSKNVRVLALCPGPTKTDFFKNAGSDQAAVGQMRSVDDVLKSMYHAIEKNKLYIVDGSSNKIASQASRLLSRKLMVKIVSKQLKPSHKS